MVNINEDVCTYCDCIVHPGDGRVEKRNGNWTVIHIDCFKERNKEVKSALIPKKPSSTRNLTEDVCIYCDCIVPPYEGYLEVIHGRIVAIHADCLKERKKEKQNEKKK